MTNNKTNKSERAGKNLQENMGLIEDSDKKRISRYEGIIPQIGVSLNKDGSFKETVFYSFGSYMVLPVDVRGIISGGDYVFLNEYAEKQGLWYKKSYSVTKSENYDESKGNLEGKITKGTTLFSSGREFKKYYNSANEKYKPKVEEKKEEIKNEK